MTNTAHATVAWNITLTDLTASISKHPNTVSGRYNVYI